MAKKYFKGFITRCLICIILFLLISIICNFSDKNLFVTKFPNALTKVLDIVFRDVFNIKLDFNDYDTACAFAKKQYYSDCNRIVLPDNVPFEWSPLNGYDFCYISNDNQNNDLLMFV